MATHPIAEPGEDASRADARYAYNGSVPRLWRLVIYTAICDIFRGKPRERREAIRWLSSQDMEDCCDAAQVSPAKVRDLASTIWGLPETERVNLLHQLRWHLDRGE
mgnify:FL=1